MLEEARRFAIEAHADQRYGSKPYAYHLDKVVGHLSAYGDEAQIIGYLHDVVEDTVVSVEDLEANFGATVAACVALLTDEPGATRKVRKQKTYQKMQAVSAGSILELGLIVKAADRLANFEECVLNSDFVMLQKYIDEHPTFRNAAYRPGQGDDLWEKMDAIVANYPGNSQR